VPSPPKLIIKSNSVILVLLYVLIFFIPKFFDNLFEYNTSILFLFITLIKLFIYFNKLLMLLFFYIFVIHTNKSMNTNFQEINK